jgi:hypothetical protein
MEQLNRSLSVKTSEKAAEVAKQLLVVEEN